MDVDVDGDGDGFLCTDLLPRVAPFMSTMNDC